MTASKINKQRLRDDFSRAAGSYDAAAVVQHAICDRVLERLEELKLQPRLVLDIGVGTGRSLKGLQSRFPDSAIIACDIALPMLMQCRREHADMLVCSDAGRLPFVNASIDLIFSTSTFQWCADLNMVLSECGRVLSSGGTLIFSTFGPDTLWQLRNSWTQVDDLDHVHDFIDMHHIGDALLEAQFSNPVVDMEVITVQYQSLRRLLQDLKDTGSRGKLDASTSKTAAGLTSKEKYQSLVKAYEQYRQENGLLPASYEVIYGYARKSATGKRLKHEVTIPVASIKRT